jgi:hypothetical protein
MGGRPQEGEPLRVIETVRCLSCGSVYSRPRQRSTAVANPGCPECTYVGWEPFSSPGPFSRSHYDADHQQHRSARRR